MSISCVALIVLSGCAGTHLNGARSALLVTDGVVDRLDERIAPMVDAASVRAREEAQSREDFDRIMKPWYRVSSAITGVQVALRASATTIEAVEAGQGGDVLGSIGCAVEALTKLADLLPTVGVDVPALLKTGIALLRDFSSGICPQTLPAQSTPAEVAS